MDRLRNLFILCFTDVVKNCNFTPGYSFGLWKKCVIAAVADNEAIGKDSYLLWHIPWRTSFPGD